jgi:COMPASS component SPP1
MHPTGAEPTRDDAILQTPLVQDAPTQNTTGTSQGEIGEDAPMPGYSTSEKEIAALGLAALDGALNGTLDGTLDGVQDGALDGSQDAAQEKEDLAVKTEAQGAADLSTVPSSKPAGRSHKVSTSKPSEGSSDKRFLCYICIKLFTRRRSVRDHIKKIHNDTNFDMARAIEVTVDPETGESVIPLAELVKTLPPASVGEDVPATTSGQASRASSVETNTFSTPAPVAGKKRPAPDTTPAQATALKKKGTAKPRPLNTSVKKAKSEIDSSTEAATVFRSPSGTPVSARASKPPVSAKVKKQPSMSVASSPAPSDRMSIAPADDNEVEDEGEQPDVPAAEAGENEADDENEVFCICRKGDNHTWMIGCDGGCEDWFHGKCVNIQERDGDLIDKYICPNCEDKGRGQTTWKRMCRRKECRKPARVLAEPPSKYCTDDCKKRFWVSMVKKSDPNALVSEDGLVVIGSKVHQRNQEKKKRKHKMAREDEEYNDTNNDEESDYQEGGTKLSPSLKKKKKKKKSISPTMTKSRKKDSLGEDALSSDEEPPLSTKGGALSIGDIKMMLNQAKTVDEIRQLGQKPPTPPYTSDADMDDPDTKMADGVNHDSQHDQNPFPYNSEEHAHLQRLSARKRQLRDRLQLLRDQEKLLAMIAARSFALVEDLDVPKAKNVCGFDARLSWSTAEFEDWRGSLAGRLALEKGEIGDPDSGTESVVKDERPDNVMVNGVGNEIEEDENDDDENDGEGEGDGCSTRRTLLRGICIRNKCPRHREWRRLLASEYKFEEEVVRRQMRKMEAEGKEIRERAAMRVLCEQE